MTTGWIGSPGVNAPNLKWIKALPFVVVASGNSNTSG